MDKIWKLSLIRFSIFQFILLIIINLIFILNGIDSKKSQAILITSSIRNYVLIGDSRTVVNALTVLRNNFKYIVVRNNNNKILLEVGNPEFGESFLNFNYVENILASEGLDSKVASVQYHYSLLEFFKNSFKVWLIFLISSLPFLIIEKNRLLAKHNETLKWKEAEMRKNISEQVSHDIRSPLAVLQEILKQSDHLSNIEIQTMKTVTQRIEDIANDLLLKTHGSKNIKVDFNANSAFIINEVKKIIAEKKYQFSDKSNVNILFSYPEDEILIEISKVEFYRLISNLINNSYEAIELSGTINILIEKLLDNVKIIISDNGKGIPENIISKIGERGFTHNKNKINSGHGLGLYHAKKTILDFNGTFEVNSSLSRGTEIIITLPLVINSNDETTIYEYVYIDDDEMLRLIWENVAKNKNKKLLALDTIDNFDSYLPLFNKDLTKFYIDFELGQTKPKGLEFAIKLNKLGYKKIYIATGHPASQFEEYTWLNHTGKKCPI
jgi:signal transduction histidine kinase